MSTSPALPPVLIVDDSDDELFHFKHMLRKAGVMNPCHAVIGAESLFVLLSSSLEPGRGSERPLACFVDLEMAGVDGFEVLRWIRGQSAFDSLPVIMLSVSGDVRDIRKSAKLGAQCYLTKYPATGVLADLASDAGSFAGSPEAFDKPYNQLLPHRRKK
jgi:CheY-like chemotaxis protein